MKLTLVYLLVFLNTMLYAQQTEDAWVYFLDKPLSTQFIENPKQMLSQKALDRREKQKVAISDSDVPIHQPYITQISSQKDILVKSQSKWLNCIHIQGSQLAINELMQFSFVKKIVFADRSLNTAVSSKQTKNQTTNSIVSNNIQTTASEFQYGNSLSQIKMLNGDSVHQSGYTGKDIVVAVFDSGFLGVNTTSTFQKARENNQLLEGYDFVHKSSNVYTSDSHGTNVLSCMVGFQSDQLIGTAPDAIYYLFITEDVLTETPLEESYWVQAAEKADSLGVDIITSSLGYSTYDNPNYSYTYSDMDGKTSLISQGLEEAFSKGIVCVIAAGNEGNDSWRYITTPADAVSALTVGSVDFQRQYSLFSSIGPTSDNRLKPDLVAQGEQTVVSTFDGTIKKANGTSFSTPIIAGMIACVKQAYPNISNQSLLQQIKESCNSFSSPDFKLGFGIPDFNKVIQNKLSDSDDMQSKLRLYPNPVNTYLQLTYLGETSDLHILVYDMYGAVLFEYQGVNNDIHQINTESWSRGLYFVCIYENDVVTVDKLVKR